MSQKGIGYNLGVIFGRNNRGDLYTAALGKTISHLTFDSKDHKDGALKIGFTDGTGILIHDDARSCCESRFMSSDDLNTAFYLGATLMEIEVKEGPTVEADGEPHEQMFLEVKTSKGVFTITMHNQHNGYYGGIAPVVQSWIPV